MLTNFLVVLVYACQTSSMIAVFVIERRWPNEGLRKDMDRWTVLIVRVFAFHVKEKEKGGGGGGGVGRGSRREEDTSSFELLYLLVVLIYANHEFCDYNVSYWQKIQAE